MPGESLPGFVCGVLERRPEIEAACEAAEKLLPRGEAKAALAELRDAFQTQPWNRRVLELVRQCFRELGFPERANAVWLQLERLRVHEESCDVCRPPAPVLTVARRD